MMLEIAARAAQVLIALGGAYLVAFWFVLVVWTFRDIESRTHSVFTQVFSTLMVVLFFVPGVLLYLILRPKETLDEAFQRSLEEEYLLQDLDELPLCPSCHRYIEDDFVLCPHCHAQLREPCASCARLVDLRWPLCPYCGAVQHGRPEADRVEAPAARWTAPGLRRRRTADEPQPARVAAEREATERELTPQVAAAAERTDEPVEPGVPRLSATTTSLLTSVRSLVRPLDRFRPHPTDGGPIFPSPANGAANGHAPFTRNGEAGEGLPAGYNGQPSFVANGSTPGEQPSNGASADGLNGHHRVTTDPGEDDRFLTSSLVLFPSEPKRDDEQAESLAVTWPGQRRE